MLASDVNNFAPAIDGINEQGNGIVPVLQIAPALVRRVVQEIATMGAQLRDRLEATMVIINDYSVQIEGKFQELDSKAGGV